MPRKRQVMRRDSSIEPKISQKTCTIKQNDMLQIPSMSCQILPKAQREQPRMWLLMLQRLFQTDLSQDSHKQQ
jgi:hypothetical protein